MATFKEIEQANKNTMTTDIKGKDYVMVNQRVKAFRMVYPDGLIQTEIVSLQDGVVTFKASIYDGLNHLLATGFAQEKESSSFINKTSYIENCVPLKAQILTADGWKYYYQLHEGDMVYSLNIDTKKIELTRLNRINFYEKRPLLSLESSRFKATCTKGHKWVAKTQYKDIEKISTEDLTNSWKIVQAVEQNVIASDDGKKLGWLMCDCVVTEIDGMASTAYINQSKYVEEITKLFGEGRLTKKYKDSWLDNYEWVVKAKDVRDIFGKFGMATYRDLPKAMCVAGIEDVKGCYDSMMLADGENRGFSSTYKELVEAVQIMCARLGIATTFITARMMKNSTKPIYTLGIKTTDGAWFSELNVKNVPPQDVWCPTTENGTWIMKLDGFVTLTSNCETSAIGRALGFCGFGIDSSIASYEEVANAIQNQENVAELIWGIYKKYPKSATLKQYIKVAQETAGVSKLRDMKDDDLKALKAIIDGSLKTIEEEQNAN